MILRTMIAMTDRNMTLASATTVIDRKTKIPDAKIEAATVAVTGMIRMKI